MEQIKVAVFVGSLRKDSFNRCLARAVEKLAPAEFTFEFIRIDDLPLYSQDLDADYPLVCRRLKKDVESADALLFVTPGYNRSVPGVLKNAIDIASRPHGTNSFAGKPGALLGASLGAPGTCMAQHHLRYVLSYLDIPTMTQPEVFIHFTKDLITSDGKVTNPGTEKFLQDFVNQYATWINRF